MRTKKPAASKKKPAGTAKRTRPRVEETPPGLHMAGASLSEKQAPKIHSTATTLADGEVLVSAVLAETVPVAQYANVVIGPAGLQWKLGGIDMSILSDADFSEDFDYDELTAEQKAVYDKVYGALRATIKITEHVISEDRETVERSIRQHNEREAAEAKKPARKSSSRKRSSSD